MIYKINRNQIENVTETRTTRNHDMKSTKGFYH